MTQRLPKRCLRILPKAASKAKRCVPSPSPNTRKSFLRSADSFARLLALPVAHRIGDQSSYNPCAKKGGRELFVRHCKSTEVSFTKNFLEARVGIEPSRAVERASVIDN